MQDHPDGCAILDLVVAHLREKILPHLPAHPAFETRVIISALELVRREFSLQPSSDRAEILRLEKLLGHGADLRSLNQSLCAAIAAGVIDLDTPGLMEHLRATALEKLAVDQPKYSTYQRALAQQSGARP
jgi:hypothetical protein